MPGGEPIQSPLVLVPVSELGAEGAGAVAELTDPELRRGPGQFRDAGQVDPPREADARDKKEAG